MASEALTSQALFPSRELIPPLREVIFQLTDLFVEVRQAILDRFSFSTKTSEEQVTCFSDDPNQSDSEPEIVGALK